MVKYDFLAVCKILQYLYFSSFSYRVINWILSFFEKNVLVQSEHFQIDIHNELRFLVILKTLIERNHSNTFSSNRTIWTASCYLRLAIHMKWKNIAYITISYCNFMSANVVVKCCICSDHKWRTPESSQKKETWRWRDPGRGLRLTGSCCQCYCKSFPAKNHRNHYRLIWLKSFFKIHIHIKNFID